MPNYTLGLDVGGTKIQVGLVNNKNKVVDSRQFSSGTRTSKKMVLKNIIDAATSLYNKNVKAIGVGITGQTDLKSGVVTQSPNLPGDWRNVPLKKIINNKFKVPVLVDNDVNCIALAEATIGKGKNYNLVFSLALGTGIGAGYVINKKLYRGAFNAIEYGHTFISEMPFTCSCRQTGHLESFVSGPGMTRIYKELTGRRKNPRVIETEAHQGKSAAKKTLAAVSFYLGIGLSNIVHTINPEIIILGGGLSRVKEITKPAIREAKKRFIFPSLQKTKIVVSSLGYDAGIIGASLLTNPRYL